MLKKENHGYETQNPTMQLICSPGTPSNAHLDDNIPIKFFFNFFFPSLKPQYHGGSLRITSQVLLIGNRSIGTRDAGSFSLSVQYPSPAQVETWRRRASYPHK